MDITPADRWILVNQYRILERLEPEEAERHRQVREALERGEPALIAKYAAFLGRMDPPLSEEDAAFVRAVLSLYDALQQSRRALEDTSGIDLEHVRFPGFDKEREAALRAYARAQLEANGPFAGLDRTPELEAAGESAPMYRRMLEAWRVYGESQSLSKVQTLYILESGSEPTHD